MARMKVEFLDHWHAKHGVSTQTRLTAYLPRYAAFARRLAPLINLRNLVPGLAVLAEKLTGMSRKRKLPAWRRDIYRKPPPKQAGKDVLMFFGSLSRYFEPVDARPSPRVLREGGTTVPEKRS